MNAVDHLFQELRRQRNKAFIPFVPAGDPDLETSAALVRELVRRGAHLVEIGFPYSDPIADGSVIQASYTRALRRGLHVDDVLGLVNQLRDLPAPLVGMISYSLVHHRGPQRFIANAAAAGLAGAIVPDLPVEEGKELAELAGRHDFKLIQLVTPTTQPARAGQIVKNSTGFVYCVSVAGITGERDRVPSELLDRLRWLRTQTDLPLCVGFGISRPDQVQVLRAHVDGIIVGSALVRPLEHIGPRPAPEVVREIGLLATDLMAPLKAPAVTE